MRFSRSRFAIFCSSVMGCIGMVFLVFVVVPFSVDPYVRFVFFGFPCGYICECDGHEGIWLRHVWCWVDSDVGRRVEVLECGDAAFYVSFGVDFASNDSYFSDGSHWLGWASERTERSGMGSARVLNPLLGIPGRPSSVGVSRRAMTPSHGIVVSFMILLVFLLLCWG